MEQNNLPVVSGKDEVTIRKEFGVALQEQITSKRLLVGALGVGAVVVALPLAIMAVQLGFALAAIAALGVAGVYSWKKMPLWISKMENRIKEENQIEMIRHLNALKATARKNPIEQLQNHLIQKRKQLNQFKEAVVTIGAQVKSIEDMLTERKAKKPQNDYSKKEASLRAMEEAYYKMRKMASDGEKAIEQFTEIVEDKKFDWKFAQAGQSAMQNLRAMSGQELLEEMLADEAFDSIRDNFNRVFSDIEIEIGNLNTKNQLKFDDEMTIDVSNIHIPGVKNVST